MGIVEAVRDPIPNIQARAAINHVKADRRLDGNECRRPPVKATRRFAVGRPARPGPVVLHCWPRFSRAASAVAYHIALTGAESRPPAPARATAPRPPGPSIRGGKMQKNSASLANGRRRPVEQRAAHGLRKRAREASHAGAPQGPLLPNSGAIPHPPGGAERRPRVAPCDGATRACIQEKPS